MVSNSRRTPWATPAASFINLAISSKNRLLVWVISARLPPSDAVTMAIPSVRRKSIVTRAVMPLFVIPFPAFDPVLVHLGPLAIRWYALAYIFGILLGWLYARALIRNDALWGGKAPMTLTQFDDFILWVTLGIILGGRIGYVLFYNLPHFIAHPAEIFELWNGGMSFHGGFTGCVLAVVLFATKRGIPIFSLGDVTCA